MPFAVGASLTYRSFILFVPSCVVALLKWGDQNTCRLQSTPAQIQDKGQIEKHITLTAATITVAS